MATIFISHSSRNDALASMLANWLRANGFDDLFIDHDQIRSGDKWTEALRRAKGACRIVLCLVTPEWLASDECYGEFLAGWYGGRRIIPLLALNGPPLDEKQRSRLGRVLLEDQGADLGKAGAPEALDLDAHPDVAGPLKAGLRAAGALAKIGLDPYAFEVDRQVQPEPFPGLESYGDTDADAAIFFGRSQEISQCLEDLREIRATGDRRAYVILGASGSGKSSLMKAGVLPRIRRERAWLALRVFRPGSDPILNFADAISQSAEAVGVTLSPGTLRDKLVGAWKSGGNLRGVLDSTFEPIKSASGNTSATVLIGIDQGEELARSPGESAGTLGAYLRAALGDRGDHEAGAYGVIFTLRSDSFREFETAKAFEGLQTRAQNIRALPIHRFASTIEQPAARYGVEIEPQLVDTLMDDATGHDALPLLAFTLQRLWRQYEKERVIRKLHYDSMGKISGVIEDAAERALRRIAPSASNTPLRGRISSAQDREAAHVFVPALAQLNERGSAVRRAAPLSSFDDDAKALLEGFAEWRLVVTSDETVEVAHEAMFREWPRSIEWLAQEKGRLEALQSLETAAAGWYSRGQEPDDLLHRGKRLAEARALDQLSDYRLQLDRNTEARSYLTACIAAQRGRRLASFARGGGIAVAVLLVVSVPAILHQLATAAEAKAHRQAVIAAEGYRPTSPVLSVKADPSRLRPGSIFRDCPECPEEVVIPAGNFTMGSPANEADRGPDEGPRHLVSIPKFAAGKFDITFNDWAICVKGGGCRSNPTPRDFEAGRGRRPVVDVSWMDTLEYVTWLSNRTGRRYRLLSESEWEYAARAWTTTPYWTGKSITSTQANFNKAIGASEPVGSYPPDGFGLYDMVGNAWQWVEDCYHQSYQGAPTDGSAWLVGDCSRRMIRGGSWYNSADILRSANRDAYSSTERLPHATLRVARDL